MWLDSSVSGMYHCCTGLVHSPLPQINISRWLLRGLPRLHHFSAAESVHLHPGLPQRDTAANDDSQQWIQPQCKLKNSLVLQWIWRTKSFCWASWQVLLPGAVPTGRQGGGHTVGTQKLNSGGREWAPLSRQLIVEYVMHRLGWQQSLARASLKEMQFSLTTNNKKQKYSNRIVTLANKTKKSSIKEKAKKNKVSVLAFLTCFSFVSQSVLPDTKFF